MLFQVRGDDHIRIVDEHAAADVSGGENTFGSGQELQRVASTWPMKRLLEIWNHLPGVSAVTRFTDRQTAIRRLWRALQPEAEPSAHVRRRRKTQPQPMFREGSKGHRFTGCCRGPKAPRSTRSETKPAGRRTRCGAFSHAICRNRAAQCARLRVRASASIA